MTETRPISWIRAARKAFEKFPDTVQENGLSALTIAADGGKADNAKPLKGLDSGILEVVLPARGDTYRVVYATRIDSDLWVLHAFQKKSKSGIKTPKQEIDVVRSRIKRLKEMLR